MLHCIECIQQEFADTCTIVSHEAHVFTKLPIYTILWFISTFFFLTLLHLVQKRSAYNFSLLLFFFLLLSLVFFSFSEIHLFTFSTLFIFFFHSFFFFSLISLVLFLLLRSVLQFLFRWLC